MDYGQPEFYDATGTLLDATASQFGNPYLFYGREWDEELGYYYFRNRYMDPGLGRFVSRDPLGMWGDPLNLGNGYTYAASNPWSLVDPYGLKSGGNLIEWLKGVWDGWMDYDVPTTNYGQGENIDAASSRAASRGDQAGNDAIANYYLDGDPLDKSSSEFLSAAGTDAKAHLLEGAVDAAENGAYNGAAIVGGIGAGKAIEEGLEKAKSTGAWGKIKIKIKSWFKGWGGGDSPKTPARAMPRPDNTRRIHGNSLDSDRPATLYEKYDANGHFEKWGVTQGTSTRYSQKNLAGGRLVPRVTGPRTVILEQERYLVERSPGPMNNEPWAGTKEIDADGFK